MPGHQQAPQISVANEDSHGERHDSVETQPRTNGLKPKACNNCRQQKLRCELTKLDTPSSNACSRCQRLELECRVDDTFKRTRKRKVSTELEEEINKLKRQLSVYEGAGLRDVTVPAVGDPAARTLTEGDGPPAARDRQASRDLPDPLTNRIFSTTVPGGISPDSPDGTCLPGTTTIPQNSLLESGSTGKGKVAASRTLRDIELPADVINDLFRMYVSFAASGPWTNTRHPPRYFSQYHAYLPFLDPGVSPTQYYDNSTLLFWSIISVASRRYLIDPTLLTRLARAVTDLLWKSLQIVPQSLGVVQSLVLLCTWPFPTSSSTTDPTYMLSGMIIQLSIQMGLHRPRSPLDFTKFRVKLSPRDIEDRRRTWIAGNVVTQSISFGVGLPTPAQLCDWSILASSLDGSRIDEDLHAQLKCALTCNRISQALTSSVSDSAGLLPTRERIPLYTILKQEIVDLENSREWTRATTAFYLHIVKLHLHAFCLLDDPSASGYLERIVTLYSAATAMIEHVRDLDSQSRDFLQFCPVFYYEVLLCAALVLLKVIKNDYFAAIIDVDSGKKLITFSVSALRKMSVANNDLPGRLSDVLAYLWTHPNPSILGGSGVDRLQLEVRSRMSMSVVYDSLWRWREQFRTEVEGAESQDLNNGNVTTSDWKNSKADSTQMRLQLPASMRALTAHLT
ncbi:C6 transcription factor [Fonsecaea pedrosoi]|nr:C6 transcription factor [Fonsecaea pedrosoi]